MVMAVDVAAARSFQAGTPKLLFRLPASPLGSPGEWKNVTRDGQQFVFTVPVASPSR
jgi:hypothetical protein